MSQTRLKVVVLVEFTNRITLITHVFILMYVHMYFNPMPVQFQSSDFQFSVARAFYSEQISFC